MLPPQDIHKPQAATFVVSASDSLNKEKANYVCDGVDDQVEIQATIDALPSSGGKVILLEGTFTISESINPTKDNINIQGMGRGTLLKLRNGITTDISIFEASNKKSIEIYDMVLDGNWKNQTLGNHYGVIFSGCLESKTDCWIENFRNADQKIDSLVYGNSVEKVTFINRYYSDDYMPRHKFLLDIAGADGWSIVEGSATLSDSDDSIYGGKSLKVVVPGSGSVTIEHDLDVDLRFYPLINLIDKLDHIKKLPEEGFKIALLDSEGNRVISHSNRFWASYVVTEDEVDRFAKWHFDIASFDWSEEKYWILGDIKKIQILITARYLGFEALFDAIEAFRGLPVPVKTFIHDDNKKDRWTYALPEALSCGVQFCYAVNPSMIEEIEENTTWHELSNLYLAGMDIISHSATHWHGISGEENNDKRYGGTTRKYWEWLAGRALLERHGFRTGMFYAHAGGHHANLPRYWRGSSNMGRCILAPTAALPYGTSSYAIPYGIPLTSAALDQLARFHLWTLSINHSLESGTFTDMANACKTRGIQIATLSQMYTQYHLKSSSHYNNLEEEIEHDYRLKTHQDIFLNLLAADDDLVSGVAGWDGTGSKQEITSFSGQPDYPRNVSVTLTGANSGEMEIYGPDVRGYEVSDVVSISAGETKYTYAAFTKVTKVIIPANLDAGDNVKVGISDKLGLTHWFLHWADVKKVIKWNAGGTSDVALSEGMFRTNAAGSIFWEAAIDLSNIASGDNFIIYYESEL